MEILMKEKEEDKPIRQADKGNKKESPKTIGELMKTWKSKWGYMGCQEGSGGGGRTKPRHSTVMEWEKRLTMGISSKLHIKRSREEPSMLMLKEKGVEEDQKEDATRKRSKIEGGEQVPAFALLEW
ncbi:hypothetical protein PIB30_046739 [Stylosanthes scabra]|uniref:Uncharacterized protein n=1 Tax=Stylosanthes scabra TaxID=79078 RepID=A0ABU6RGX0_9FABA|nr:hypothetical protein [Stylosanthes scabra]